MAEATKSIELNAPAGRVWELVGDFNSLAQWHPGVEDSQLNRADDDEDGGETHRTLRLAGGGQLRERLEDSDDQEMFYSYSIIDGPLPVENYTATLQVRETGGESCRVEWTGSFDPSGASEADAVRILESVYTAGLENLRKQFGGPTSED